MMREYAATGVDAVGVDTGSDIGAVAAMLPAHVAVQGNLDPLALVAGGTAMAARPPRFWTPCGAGRSSSIWAMASCRRPRPSMWRRCWSLVRAADGTEPASAIVLFNLGGPDRPEAIRPFLLNLFRDPAILRVPFFVRPFLARIIARARLAPATANYALLGGKSPLLGSDPGSRPRRWRRRCRRSTPMLHRHALLASVQPGSGARGQGLGPG